MSSFSDYSLVDGAGGSGNASSQDTLGDELSLMAAAAAARADAGGGRGGGGGPRLFPRHGIPVRRPRRWEVSLDGGVLGGEGGRRGLPPSLVQEGERVTREPQCGEAVS